MNEVPTDQTVHSGPCAHVTPPKDPSETLLLEAARAPTPVASNGDPRHSWRRRLEAPFTPIQYDQSQDFELLPLREEKDFEPLPFRQEISSNDDANNHPWHLVYSPLQDDPAADLGAENQNGERKSLEGKCPPLANGNEMLSTPDNREAPTDQQPHGDTPTRQEEPPPYPHPQWPMCPPPYYWYPPYPHYGYPGHYRAQDDQSSRGPPFPVLGPKPPAGHYHAYRPAPPYGHFGKSLLVAQPQPAEYISKATEYDVICGRGGAVNNHSGNRRFRSLIQDHKRAYLNESKQRKPFVAMRVLEAVKNSTPPGRFLVKYHLGYLICSDDRAREKASQALREGAAKLRKEGCLPENGAGETATQKRELNINTVLLPHEKAKDQVYCDDPRMGSYAECFDPPRNPKKRRIDQNPTRLLGVSGSGSPGVQARSVSEV